MSEPLPREIRCVLIPSGGVRLLFLLSSNDYSSLA